MCPRTLLKSESNATHLSLDEPVIHVAFAACTGLHWLER